MEGHGRFDECVKVLPASCLANKTACRALQSRPTKVSQANHIRLWACGELPRTESHPGECEMWEATVPSSYLVDLAVAPFTGI